MRAARTQNVGNRTAGTGALQLSRTAVKGKDPKYDYSFRRKDEASMQVAAQQGWEPVTSVTRKSEEWASPVATHAVNTKGKGEIHIEDTMLYRRPKSASAFYKQIEDRKYNAQISHVNSAAERAKLPVRGIEEGKISVADTSSTKFTQRIGVNDDMDDDIFS